MFNLIGRFWDLYVPIVFIQILLYTLSTFFAFNFVVQEFEYNLKQEAQNQLDQKNFKAFTSDRPDHQSWSVEVLIDDDILYYSKKNQDFWLEQQFLLKLFFLLTLFIIIINIKIIFNIWNFLQYDTVKINEYLKSTPEKRKLLENTSQSYAQLNQLCQQYSKKSTRVINTSESVQDQVRWDNIYNFFEQMPMNIVIAKDNSILWKNKLATEIFGTVNDVDELDILKQNKEILENKSLKKNVWNNHVPFYINQEKRFYSILQIKLEDKDVWFFFETHKELIFELRKVIHHKLISVTDLATGIAHELNNPLCILLTGALNFTRHSDLKSARNIEAAKKLDLCPKKLDQYFKKMKLQTLSRGIEEAGHRMAKIIWKILSLKKKQHMKFSYVPPQTVADNALLIAMTHQSSLDASDLVTLVKDYQKDCTTLYCRAFELEFALVEILKNAFFALQKKEKSKRILMYRLYKQNNMTIFEIVDNADGVSELYQNRVFDPFFTMNPTGQGLGLGLYISYHIIVEQHKGQISFFSKPGKGTKVILGIPDN